MEAHLVCVRACNPNLSHEQVLLQMKEFQDGQEKDRLVQKIYGYSPLPKAYFYKPPEATTCLYPFCFLSSCYLLPFMPPDAVTYKSMMHALGTLPAKQREALRKALRMIDKSPRYPKQLSPKLVALLPKMYKGDIQLHDEEAVVCHTDDMEQVTDMDDYFRVLFECFRKKRLMWWRTLFDVNIMAEKQLELLGAGATIQGETYVCKPIVHKDYGHMMIQQGKVSYYSFASFRPGMALVCLFCEGPLWTFRQIQSNFTKKDREELKKPLQDQTRTFVYQMQTEFIPFCQLSYDKVLHSMEALNKSIQDGTLELKQECIHDDASEMLISAGTYQITEVDVLKQIVSSYNLVL